MCMRWCAARCIGIYTCVRDLASVRVRVRVIWCVHGRVHEYYVCVHVCERVRGGKLRQA